MKADRQSVEELVRGIGNERVREIIVSRGNLGELLGDQREIRRKHHQEIREHQHYLNQCEERKWLTKKGKKYLIDFDNGERKKMKQCFNTLDRNKTGLIGIDQLEQFLFSVGLVETREEIKALIDSVDEGKTGKIQFSEFLSMIQNDQGQNQEIVSFFKSVIGGKHDQSKKGTKVEHLGKTLHGGSVHKQFKKAYQTGSSMYVKNDRTINRSSLFKKSNEDRHSLMEKGKNQQIAGKYPYPKGLSFEMVVSHIRRKYMMTALNIGKPQQKVKESILASANSSVDNKMEEIAKGQKVMQALQKMYERRLIRQIKEKQRSSQQSFKASKTKTEPNTAKMTLIHKLNRLL